MAVRQPTLYHLTCEPWWMLIAQHEVLLSMEEKRRQNIGQGNLGGGFAAHSVPQTSEWDVVLDSLVWFTQNRTPVQQWQTPVAGTEPHQKGAIRLEVDLPEVIRWSAYSREVGFPRKYYDALNETGQGQAHLWWVSPVPVPIEHWVEARRMRDDLVLWRRD